jgi:predicted O-methyltransferase YrrM
MEDLILQAALQHALAKATGPVQYPVQYLRICRDCWVQRYLSIVPIREAAAVPAELASAHQRFQTLVTALQQLPPLSFSLAQTIAAVADRYQDNRAPLESVGWLADVSTHFQLSSSFGEKGRILSAIVRYMRSRNGLELGTAYGMSGLFILAAMQDLGPDYHLATLEGSQPQYALSSALLKEHHGDHVTSYLGWTQNKLPLMAQELSGIDFLFHDARHSREDYLRDVQTLLPTLSAGAVVVMDDIRWDDRRFYDGNPRTYEGWLELAHGPRVMAAVEVDENIGIMLLGAPSV